MSYRMITTCIAMLVFAGGFLAAGCGGGDSSPTSPPTPQPPTPPPPPPPPTISQIEVSPATVSLEVGKTQRFVAAAKGSDGSVISGVDFTWSSNNIAVATINSGGVATAVSPGTATIRATGNGITSAPATITVTVPPVSGVTVSPSSTQELMVGEMVTFTATARTAGGTVRDDVSITWSSSDTSVVIITSAGVATAVGAGSAMVRATAGSIMSSPVTVNVTEPPPPAPVIATVAVSPPEASIEEGQTQQFEAMAATADGMAVPDVEFAWASSDEMVATVDSNGLATGVSAGEVTITATADSVSGTAVLMVTEAPLTVATVTVSPAEATIEEGETQQFEAIATTSDGTAVPDAEFTWASSDEMVATIDSDGLARGAGEGEVMITATADGVTGTATLTVTGPPPPPPPPPPPTVATVTVIPAEASIEEGQTKQFEAMAATADGMVLPDVMFMWSSSDEMVATVDENGLATAVGAGQAMITATADSISGMAMLTVTEPPAPMVSTVTLIPTEATIETGQEHSFEAIALAADGTEITDVAFTWSSSDEMVATVDSNGLATGVGAGQAMITATADGVSGMATLTVNEPPPPPPPPVVSTVTVSPSEATIEEGQTQQFEAMAATADGMVLPDVMFMWSSSDEMVATVDENGLATAVGAGQVTITATADGVSGTASLTVTEPPAPMVSTVTLIPTEATIEVGQEYSFEAIALATDGNEITDAEFMWSSSDTLVATVDENGLATGVGAGVVMIIATADSVSGMATLTVNEPPPPPPPPPVVSTVTVSPSEATIEAGQTLQFEAMAATADGMAVPDVELTWSSSDDMVATVDENGLATGVGAGQAMITATADSISGMAMLTVTEPPPEVDRVEVTPSAASIEEGDTRRFTARAYDSDNDRITGKTFTWTSSNTSVATISPSSGTATTATGVNAGSTTIRATVDGVSGTASLRVTEPPPPPPTVSTVTVSPSSASIEEGKTRRFTATARESDGTVISGKTFRWTSSNTSVATVSPSSGRVTTATGVNAGSTTIRATVDGVSGTASLRVTAPPPPPPPMLKSRTATISGNYSARGNLTLSEVAGGKLKLTITNFRSTAPDTWLALSENSRIDWAANETLPSTARSFGEVTGQTSVDVTFTPPSGKDIDSYDYVILYCRAFDLLISSNPLSN